MEPALIAVVVLALVVLLVAGATAAWLGGALDAGPRELAHHEKMDAARTVALQAARDRGHVVVGPTTDTWIYHCEVRGCLGVVGVVEDHHGEPGVAGTAAEHACPTAVATPWEAPTHHRHGGPAHDH